MSAGVRLMRWSARSPVGGGLVRLLRGGQAHLLQRGLPLVHSPQHRNFPVHCRDLPLSSTNTPRRYVYPSIKSLGSCHRKPDLRARASTRVTPGSKRQCDGASSACDTAVPVPPGLNKWPLCRESENRLGELPRKRGRTGFSRSRRSRWDRLQPVKKVQVGPASAGQEGQGGTGFQPVKRVKVGPASAGQGSR